MELTVMFEDEDILVCYKPPGVPTQTKSPTVPDMESMVKNYLCGAGGPPSREDRHLDASGEDRHAAASGGDRHAFASERISPMTGCKEPPSRGGPPYVGVVHRLDQPVEGVMVFAKNKKAAADLCAQAAGGGMEKYYYAIVRGQLQEKEGRLEHELLKDGRRNCSMVVAEGTKGAKHAALTFQLIEQRSDCALVAIRLETGRHHQIRVQFAAVGHPLLGDRKYGGEQKRTGSSSLALCAVKLCFTHPRTGGKMEFSVLPSGEAFRRCGFCRA